MWYLANHVVSAFKDLVVSPLSRKGVMQALVQLRQQHEGCRLKRCWFLPETRLSLFYILIFTKLVFLSFFSFPWSSRAIQEWGLDQMNHESQRGREEKAEAPSAAIASGNKMTLKR